MHIVLAIEMRWRVVPTVSRYELELRIPKEATSGENKFVERLSSGRELATPFKSHQMEWEWKGGKAGSVGKKGKEKQTWSRMKTERWWREAEARTRTWAVRYLAINGTASTWLNVKLASAAVDSSSVSSVSVRPAKSKSQSINSSIERV